MIKIYYVSSLPRSGSTLMMNLLGQNPAHYVTPTSGLIEMFVSQRNGWKNILEFKAEGLSKVQPRVKGSLKGLIYGFFEQELLSEKVCFDKSRGWFQYIEDLEQVMGEKVKVICNVRDPREIMASFEKIYRRRGIDYDYALGDGFFKCQSIEGRCEHLLSAGGVVGRTINRLRDALARGLGNRLLIVPYKSFTKNPTFCMQTMHNWLDLPKFSYDCKNVKQVTHEDDAWHGMDLHIIKPEIKEQEQDWEKILPAKYAAQLADRYPDIIKMAG